MKTITRLVGFVGAAIRGIIHTTKGPQKMKFEDLKFRYIIPLAEKDEQDQPGFLFDKSHLTENKEADALSYKDFVCGEAMLLCRHSEGTADEIFRDMAIDGFDFPAESSPEERAIAYFTVRFRRPGWDDAKIQNGISGYFAGSPIVRSDDLERFFGYPY